MGQLPDVQTLKNSEFSAPNRQGNFIQRMAHDIGDIRNVTILNRIDDALKTHCNVLIIYGWSHYFQQFKVLQKKYGAPPYDAIPRIS